MHCVQIKCKKIVDYTTFTSIRKYDIIYKVCLGAKNGPGLHVKTKIKVAATEAL